MNTIKGWLFYQLVHCPLLWGKAPDYVWVNDKLHGPYEPRWEWVSRLFSVLEPK